jgi:hypothetical protein
MHSSASVWTRNRLRLTLIITLRLPRPFGVFCTCAPVELALLKSLGDYLGFWGPVWYDTPGVSGLLNVNSEIVMLGQR